MDIEQERKALFAIGVITVLSGAGQALAPQVTLGMMRAQDDPTTRHFFGTIGMFMVCAGGGLAATMTRPTPDPDALLAATAQKAGAAIAVAIGVRRGRFSPVALTVASFDAVSGLLAYRHRRRVLQLGS